MPASVPTADLRWLLAFAGLMLAGWMACAVVRALVSRMVAGVGLGGLDRLLGAGFGLARGVLIATLIVLMGGLTRMPGEPFWQNSQIVAPLEMLAQKLTPWLPEAMASRIDFNKKYRAAGLSFATFSAIACNLNRWLHHQPLSYRENVKSCVGSLV